MTSSSFGVYAHVSRNGIVERNLQGRTLMGCGYLVRPVVKGVAPPPLSSRLQYLNRLRAELSRTASRKALAKSKGQPEM